MYIFTYICIRIHIHLSIYVSSFSAIELAVFLSIYLSIFIKYLYVSIHILDGWVNPAPRNHTLRSLCVIPECVNTFGDCVTSHYHMLVVGLILQLETTPSVSFQ